MTKREPWMKNTHPTWKKWASLALLLLRMSFYYLSKSKDRMYNKLSKVTCSATGQVRVRNRRLVALASLSKSWSFLSNSKKHTTKLLYYQQKLIYSEIAKNCNSGYSSYDKTIGKFGEREELFFNRGKGEVRRD